MPIRPDARRRSQLPSQARHDLPFQTPLCKLQQDRSKRCAIVYTAPREAPSTIYMLNQSVIGAMSEIALYTGCGNCSYNRQFDPQSSYTRQPVAVHQFVRTDGCIFG